MAQKTVTRADLAEAVYESVGLSRTESAELVERFLDIIGDALVAGENVKLSSFGSFQVRSKNERIGRNPKTGEEVPILPRQVLVFKPSNVLKSKINKSMVRAGRPASGRRTGAADAVRHHPLDQHHAGPGDGYRHVVGRRLQARHAPGR